MSMPDFYRSPSGNVWTVMCFFNLEQFARQPFPEVRDGDDIPDWINAWRCRSMLKNIIRGRAAHADNDSDHVALVRVAEDEDGFQKLLLTYLSRGEVERWKPAKSNLDDPAASRRIYQIDGERASVHQMHRAFAVMRWVAPRAEQFFPLWRWELGLAAVGPVDFLMFSITHTAQEDEL